MSMVMVRDVELPERLGVVGSSYPSISRRRNVLNIPGLFGLVVMSSGLGRICRTGNKPYHQMIRDVDDFQMGRRTYGTISPAMLSMNLPTEVPPYF